MPGYRGGTKHCPLMPRWQGHQAVAAQTKQDVPVLPATLQRANRSGVEPQIKCQAEGVTGQPVSFKAQLWEGSSREMASQLTSQARR